jgi:hypothetical protein
MGKSWIIHIAQLALLQSLGKHDIAATSCQKLLQLIKPHTRMQFQIFKNYFIAPWNIQLLYWIDFLKILKINTNITPRFHQNITDTVIKIYLYYSNLGDIKIIHCIFFFFCLELDCNHLESLLQQTLSTYGMSSPKCQQNKISCTQN